MNIIELAKEAGFEVWEADYALQGQLERFANLVAANEREVLFEQGVPIVDEYGVTCRAAKTKAEPWKCACGANLYIDSNGAPASKAEPVQEPVAYIRKDQLQRAMKYPCLCEISPEPRSDRVEIYAAPVSAKAIRAEALEEAAKVCEKRIGGAVQNNEWWSGFKAAMKQCAAAIRRLK